MNSNPQEPKQTSEGHLSHPQTVYCLAVDLVKSTATGLSLRSWQNDKFNAALVGQLNPHLAALQLDHAVVKFTGDGWLIMSPTAVSQLCCLALIFRDSFQREMAALTALSMDKIPAVRAAVCSGRDLEVRTPGGQRDYVGDSVRRAVRASALSQDGEVLVSNAVCEWIQRDFDVSAVDITTERPLPKKWEEPLILHKLAGLKPIAASDSMMPADFVYTLGKVGKREDSVAAVVAVAERFQVGADTAPLRGRHPGVPSQDSVAVPEPVAAGLSRPLLPAKEWNRVLNALPDFSAAQALVRAFRKKDIPRDVITYTILANKAPNLTQALKILRLMADDSIAPDVVTYNTLVNKAESYSEAARLLEEMKAAGIAPNVVTYNTLVDKAESYSEAARLLKEMKAAGITPNVVTYSSLFAKPIKGVRAREILDWYYREEYHPCEPLNALITSFRKAHQIADALEIALEHPHLSSARRLMKQRPKEARQKFEGAKNDEPNHPTADFALGALYLEIRDSVTAKHHLRSALQTVRHPEHKATIGKWLADLDAGNGIDGRHP